MKTPAASSPVMGDAPRRRLRPAAAPDPRLLLLESRALWELGLLPLSASVLGQLPPGDGHPVLVLPGFMAGDPSTGPLRRQLRRWGYFSYGWRQGRNLGPTPEAVGGLLDRLDQLHRRHRRKVSIVGWSLGGVYARQIARSFPDKVRDVITLASPYRMTTADRSAASPLADRLAARRRGAGEWPEEDKQGPLPVPATSVYTRSDGIVRWYLCIDRSGPAAENIEVRGSHIGLGWNRSVLYLIGDRLALAEGSWRPFRPPAALRRWFPPPVDWDPRSDR